MAIPDIRIRALNEADIDPDGEFILYWMTTARRIEWNFGIQRAIQWANELQRPLVVLEALRCDYRWASDRIHQFIIQGMAEHARRLASTRVCYYPYIEAKPKQGSGLLAALAKRSCVVVGDDFPCFFLPRMHASAARQCQVRLELIDSNGLMPMRAAEKVFQRAYDFRRFIQRAIKPHLDSFPDPRPLDRAQFPELRSVPSEFTQRWPSAQFEPGKTSGPLAISKLPIDHEVRPSTIAGGTAAARTALKRFVSERLDHYAEDRNQPDSDGSSGLSPYLHAGHLSAHEVFDGVTGSVDWDPSAIAAKATGSREGWWRASRSVEAFLDELITWRELGFNMCWHDERYDQYDSLPDWSQKTLAEHADDPREYEYTREEFEQAATHDPLWNAAQRQLVREGRIHNYLRMLWGKKILEWSQTPQQALDTMIELNNKYALDGRDPNSYSGIFWVLGRYDRAWGPERPVFGKVRYMSSENTARKLRVQDYLSQYA